jgi:hypothetical protein
LLYNSGRIYNGRTALVERGYSGRGTGERNMHFYQTNPIYFARKIPLIHLVINALYNKKLAKKIGFVFENEPNLEGVLGLV